MGGPPQKGITQWSTSVMQLKFELYADDVFPQLATSPFRQKAMKGALQGYLFYGYKRAARQGPYVIIPFGLGMSILFSLSTASCMQSLFCAAYATYAWALQYDEWQNSKAGHLAGAGH